MHCHYTTGHVFPCTAGLDVPVISFYDDGNLAIDASWMEVYMKYLYQLPLQLNGSIGQTTLLIPYITNHSRWKSFVVAELNCNSWLDGSLAWPRPTAQAISLEKFHGTDRSTKTAKLFHLEQFAIYGTIYTRYVSRHREIQTYACALIIYIPSVVSAHKKADLLEMKFYSTKYSKVYIYTLRQK